MIFYARRKSSNDLNRARHDSIRLRCDSQIERQTKAKIARIETMISPDLLEILACPVCRKPLVLRGENALKCNECRRAYPIRNDIPILLEHEATIEQL